MCIPDTTLLSKALLIKYKFTFNGNFHLQKGAYTSYMENVEITNYIFQENKQQYLPFHDGPNIDTSITTFVALTNYADAKKINSIHVECNSDDVE
jgi:hypothetical protein